MADLIERLEKATEGSRELDAEIMFDLYAKPVGKHAIDGGPAGYLWPENHPNWSFGHRFPGKDREWFGTIRKDYDETLVIERDGALVLMNSLRILCVTTSIDAALTLWDEPGKAWSRGVNLFYGIMPGGKMIWRAVAWESDGQVIVGRAEGQHQCRPVATVIAALKARSTKEPQ